MNDEIDMLAIARLFQDLPRTALLVALGSIAPLCEAQGLLTADEVRPLLAILTNESEVPRGPLGISLDALFPPRAPSREEEISALYAELQVIVASGASDDPAHEARYRDCLARLRERQEAEALEMVTFAEQRRQLPHDAIDPVLHHIDVLLARHENPPRSDRTGSERG